MKTWHIETAVVYLTLIAVNVWTEANLVGWIGAIAVGLSFGCTSIGQRMTEAQEKQAVKTVHCYKAYNWYFWGKELMWVTHFIMLKSWSALVGCAVFAIYPIWRKFYTQWRDAHAL